MTAEIMNYVEDRQKSEFYPTPAHLVEQMIERVDWSMVKTILEPSAGKGDILRGVARAVRRKDNKKIDVDCIELDSNLRSILKYQFSELARDELYSRKEKITGGRNRYTQKDWHSGNYKYYDSNTGKNQFYPEAEQEQLKQIDGELECFFNDGIHIVHDDFLTYTPYKEYDLILMNPPFSEGDKHLLKALEIQKHGGCVVCLLNAETIRNPYTPTRKHLVQLLDEYNADITFIAESFAEAERRTKVEVALIKVDIPKNDEKQSLFEKLAQKKSYCEPTAGEAMELEVADFIQAVINRYKVEIESGIELIRTYQRMLPYLRSSANPGDKYAYEKPIIAVTDGEGSSCGHVMTINRYVKAVRRKYWKGLLTNQKFIGKLTAKLQKEYSEKVYSFADYDFSEFNIYTLITEINSQIKTGIEDEIIVMYDRLTEEHAYYPECKKNRHLYDGWKTNKAWKLDKKVIIPCYGIFDSWDGKPRVYEAYSVLSDIERILNFFDGNMTTDVDIRQQLELSFKNGITKNIQCKFFNVTFYKKGTVHITFTCPDLIDRYNIYAAQNKRWLPPSYGTKQYSDMTAEEQAVINSFQGEQAYNKVMSKPEYFLQPPITSTQSVLAIKG